MKLPSKALAYSHWAQFWNSFSPNTSRSTPLPKLSFAANNAEKLSDGRRAWEYARSSDRRIARQSVSLRFFSRGSAARMSPARPSARRLFTFTFGRSRAFLPKAFASFRSRDSGFNYDGRKWLGAQDGG